MSFEGTDGAGKSSSARAFESCMREAGVSCIRVDKWYTEARSGDDHLRAHMQTLNSLVFGRPRSVASALSDEHWFHMLVAWHQLVDDLVVRPAVRDGFVVIMDNSYQKTIARYLASPSVPEHIVLHAFDGLVEPALTVLLDVRPEVALRRKGEFSAVETGRTGSTEGDFVRFQTTVAQFLRAKAAEREWTLIDTSSLSVSDVIHRILSTPALVRSLSRIGKAS